MTEPGWYPDYEDGTQLRYHDGEVWTDHVHRSREYEPAASAVVVADTIEGEDLEPLAPVAPPEDSIASRVASYSILGLFIGLLFGGFVFNAVGALTPVTETTGTVTDIEIDYTRRSGSASTSTKSYKLSGTTDAGESWTIYDEDAYNVLQSQGYPQPVAIAIGDWTGTAERVTGASFDVNHQSTGALIGWVAFLGFLVLVAIGITVFAARSASGGPLPAVAFVVSFFGPGSWLGWQAFQWIQSG